MTGIGRFPSINEFVFNTPLYAPLSLSSNWEEAVELFRGKFRTDGYCTECQLPSTFRRLEAVGYGPDFDLPVQAVSEYGFRTFDVGCARDSDHRVRLYVHIEGDQIQKVGQYPSLADIANDESKSYRKVLSPADSRELHKAIGLAAHGVGIGSYVYLRRIFERLIDGRFKDFKDVENWTDDDYRNRRMPERIDLLKDHLPDFLVENRKVYSILSLGIHELAEDQALAFFPVLKASIIMILEEDEEKRKKLELKKQLKSAVEKYSPATDKGAGSQ